ncbi:MAG: hypothetical protein M0Q92_04380 [Methanoregula sp.]|nr:hypothetical protein [Methanoregula sp.]
MPGLKKNSQKITAVKAGIGIIVIIAIWLVLQIAMHMLMDTVFFRLLLICFLAVGFLIISWMLKFR